MKLTLSILPEKLGICHFDKKSPIPDWALKGDFSSITRTSQELSIVYPQEKIPGGVLFEKDWFELPFERAEIVFGFQKSV